MHLYIHLRDSYYNYFFITNTPDFAFIYSVNLVMIMLTRSAHHPVNQLPILLTDSPILLTDSPFC